VDDEVEAHEFNAYLGGDAANVAAQASKLGLKTAIISCIGNDNQGRISKVALKNLGIDISNIQTTKQKKTGMVISIVCEDGQRNLITYRGANGDLVLEKYHENILRSSKFVHISDPQPQIIKRLPELINSKETIVSFDPGAISAHGGLDKIKPIMSISKYYFCNQTELRMITNENDLDIGARLILNNGPEIVFLKYGDKGCRIYTHGKTISFPAFSVKAIDTTGAGDAFDAAMIYALIKKIPLKYAGYFANAAGALVTQSIGSQTSQPSLTKIKEFLLKNNFSIQIN
jgi:ribokinase